MISKSVLLTALVFAGLQAHAALAQTPAQTGTGGGAASTVTAPNTSSVGQTMPPAGAGGAAAERDLERRTPQQAKDKKITNGICIGC